MKIVFATGNHPRHAHVARAVARSGFLKALIIEEREAHVPQSPAGLSASTSALYSRHFRDRADSERKFFGQETEEIGAFPDVDTMRVTRDELNSPRTRAFLEQHEPDLLLSYGVHKLDAETLERVPGQSWNVHGGLSPWYRGVATMFWPSYFLEPQATGITVHLTTDAIDGGAVVHQTAGQLVRGDGIHDLASRTVSGFAAEIPELMQRAANGELKEPTEQKTSGRIWRSADWRPAHLHPIYDLYENRIVDMYLDGEFPGRDPQLVRQF